MNIDHFWSFNHYLIRGKREGMYEKFLPLPFWTLSSFSSIVQAVEILQSIIWCGRGGGYYIFVCFWIAEGKVEGSIVIRPLEKASKAITLNDQSFFGRVDRTKENSSRGDKGWAMKRARPSQKVWYSELGLLEKMSPVFKFGQGLLCGFSIRHCGH